MDEDAYLRALAVGGATRADSFSGMNPQFRSALVNMFSNAPPEMKGQLQIKSGYRSPERQAQLYQAALAKYGSPEAARKWVAPPGHSEHNKGYASDLAFGGPAAIKWAHDNAAQYGLTFPLSNENWHIELQGARGPHQHVDQPVASAGPAMQPQGMASMFDPSAAPAAAVNYDPLASAQPQTVAGDTPLGGIALMFAQQQQRKKEEQKADAQAQETRRAALFTPQPYPGVAGLYG